MLESPARPFTRFELGLLALYAGMTAVDLLYFATSTQKRYPLLMAIGFATVGFAYYRGGWRNRAGDRWASQLLVAGAVSLVAGIGVRISQFLGS